MVDARSRVVANRRTVLGLTSALVPAALVPAWTNAAAAAPGDPPRQAGDAADGYRETDHVLTAYARMRF